MATNMNEIADTLIRASEDTSKVDEESKQKLLHSAHAIINALESPAERISRTWYSIPGLMAATRTLTDLNVFKTLSASKTPLTAGELARGSNADPTLVARLLKHAATEGYVKETEADTYTASNETHELSSTGCQGMIKDSWCNLRLVHDAPQFFKDTAYANPKSAQKSIFMHSFQTDQHYFQYIFAPGNEAKAKAFHDHMSWKTFGPRWFNNSALVKSVFPKPLAKEDVLLVDIGGNTGTDLVAFSKAHPTIPGRLILQDLPSAVKGADSAELAKHRIEAMGHDMFTPQPVRGAQVYYLKMVFHDWPDAECVKALSQLKPALVPGQSTILLNEIVVPDTNAHWFETSVDLLMMTVHSAQERRESDWRRLIGNVPGLRVKKVWDVQGALEKAIEIEVV